MSTPLGEAYRFIHDLERRAVFHATSAWNVSDRTCGLVGCNKMALTDELWCKFCFMNTLKLEKHKAAFLDMANQNGDLCEGVVARDDDPFFYNIVCGQFKQRSKSRRCDLCAQQWRRMRFLQLQARFRTNSLQTLRALLGRQKSYLKKNNIKVHRDEKGKRKKDQGNVQYLSDMKNKEKLVRMLLDATTMVDHSKWDRNKAPAAKARPSTFLGALNTGMKQESERVKVKNDEKKKKLEKKAKEASKTASIKDKKRLFGI